MQVTVKDNYLNVRVGAPSVNAPSYQYLAPGSQIEVDGQLYPGDLYDGVSTWMKDAAGNYYWSGGVTDISNPTNSVNNKLSQLINWNQSIPNISSTYLNTKGNQIIVGVLDTGVEKDHPDLKANIIDNVSDFTNPNVSGIDDDEDGHGTFVAGIIGANSPFLNGIIGVSPFVKLLISKIQGNQKSEPGGEQIYKGINQLLQLEQPPHLYNLSVGFDGDCSQDLLSLLNSLLTKNVFLIAAAGDNYDLTPLDSNNVSQKIQFPAGHPACIKVGTISKDCLNIYNEISSRVDIICPSLSFWSCSNVENKYYTQLSGSSMSTAFITGIVALILSNKLINNISINNISKQDILNELKNFSTPITDFDFDNTNQFIFNIP